MQDSELNTHLDALSLAGAIFPTDLKVQLTLRKAGSIELSTGNTENLSAFLHVMSPWHSPPGSPPPPFEPRQPRLCAADGSNMERMSIFNETLCKSMVTPLIAKGASAADQLKKFCTQTLDFIENALDEDIPEDFGVGIGIISTLLKAIVYLLHPVPGYMNSTRADVEALRAGSAGSPGTLLHSASCQVLRCDYYKQLINDAVRRGSEDITHAKELKDLETALAAPLASGQEVSNVHLRLPTLRAQLRRGATKDLEQLCNEVFMRLTADCLANLGKVGSNFDFISFRSVVEKHKKILGTSATLEEVSKELESMQTDSVNQGLATAVRTACANLLEKGDFGNDASYLATTRAADDAKGLSTDAYEQLNDGTIAKAANTILDKLPELSDPPTVRTATLCLRFLGGFLAEPLASLVSTRASFCDCYLALKASYDKYPNMGTDIGARAAADIGHKHITQMMSELNIVENCQCGPEHAVWVKAMFKEQANIQGVISQTAEYLMAKAKQSVSAALATLTPIARGGAGGKSWDDNQVYVDEAEMVADAEEKLGGLGEKLTSAIADLAEQHRLYVAMGTRFSLPIGEAITKAVKETTEDATLTKATACILYAFATLSANPVSMKRSLRKSVADLDSLGLFGRLQPLLQQKLLPHVRRGST